jgi:hypothetical protein
MQGEQIAPQQTVDPLDELNEHSISSQCLDLAVFAQKQAVVLYYRRFGLFCKSGK